MSTVMKKQIQAPAREIADSFSVNWERARFNIRNGVRVLRRVGVSRPGSRVARASTIPSDHPKLEPLLHATPLMSLIGAKIPLSSFLPWANTTPDRAQCCWSCARRGHTVTHLQSREFHLRYLKGRTHPVRGIHRLRGLFSECRDGGTNVYDLRSLLLDTAEHTIDFVRVRVPSSSARTSSFIRNSWPPPKSPRGSAGAGGLPHDSLCIHPDGRASIRGPRARQ